MKVNEVGSVPQPTVSAPRREVSKSPADRVSAPSVSVNPAMGAAARAAQVRDIVHAVKSGQYYPSAQQIASQIVDDAEIDARLRAMLQGGQ